MKDGLTIREISFCTVFLMEVCRQCYFYPKEVCYSDLIIKGVTKSLEDFVTHNKIDIASTVESILDKAHSIAMEMDHERLDITNPKGQFFTDFVNEISKYCGDKLPPTEYINECLIFGNFNSLYDWIYENKTYSIKVTNNLCEMTDIILNSYDAAVKNNKSKIICSFFV